MSRLDWTADERKLESVYDDISSMRYKAAEATLARFLKKNPKSQPGLILRFVLHERLESPLPVTLKALQDARDTGELSGRSMWWVKITLRVLDQLDLCVDIHNELWTAHPESQDLGGQVFLQSVAAWNTKEMVKSSRKMFNMSKRPIWARVAAWAEWVQRAPQPTPDQPFPPMAPPNALKIAQILLSTAGTAITTPEILWFKLQLYLSSGQNRQAHDLLMKEGKGGSLARDWWRMQGIGEISHRVDGASWVWVNELQEFLSIWKVDPGAQRNYAYYRHSIEAAARLHASNPDLVTALIEAFKEIDRSIGEKERAPQLALLELDLKLSQAAASHDFLISDKEWRKAVQHYWLHWGAKGSIVTELEGIVGGRREWLNGIMQERIELGHSDEQSFRELVNARLYLLRQKPEVWVPSEEDAKECWTLYKEGLAYGRNLPDTDIQPADEIGLAAVQLLLAIDYASEHETETYILKAILCLEYIVGKSPACAQARYLLIRLYRLIGAPRLLAPHFTYLKLSEVQLDTLMHVFTERGAVDCMLGNNRELWQECIDKADKMYRRARIDAPEYLLQAAENESYSKISGLRHLSHALSYSLTRASLVVESARIGLVMSYDNPHPVPENIERKLRRFLASKEIVDNRSWELMPNIGGNRMSIPEMTKLGSRGEYTEGLRQRADAILSLVDFLRGDPISIGSMHTEELSPSDKAFYQSASGLIRRAESAVNEDMEDLSDKIELTDLLDNVLQLAAETERRSPRWAKLNSTATMLILFRIVIFISTDVVTLASVRNNQIKKAKGKQSKLASPSPSPRLQAYLSDIEAFREDYSMIISGVRGMLVNLRDEDQALDWSPITDGWVDDDEDLVRKKVKEISAARIAAVDGFLMLTGNIVEADDGQSISSRSSLQG